MTANATLLEEFQHLCNEFRNGSRSTVSIPPEPRFRQISGWEHLMSSALNDCSSLSGIQFDLVESTSSFDLDALLPVLRSHPTLHSLYLSGYTARLDAARVRLVLNAARENRNTVLIDVAGMPSNDSLDVILSSLRDFRDVRLWRTFMSGLTNENLVQLGQALRAAPNVQSLAVWCSEQNIDAVVSALRQNSFMSPFSELELTVEINSTTALKSLFWYIPMATNLYSLTIYGHGEHERGERKRRYLKLLQQALKTNGSIHFVHGTMARGVDLQERGTDHYKRVSACCRRNMHFKHFVQTQSVVHLHPEIQPVWPSLLAAQLQAHRTAPNNLYMALLAMDEFVAVAPRPPRGIIANVFLCTSRPRLDLVALLALALLVLLLVLLLVMLLDMLLLGVS